MGWIHGMPVWGTQLPGQHEMKTSNKLIMD